MYFISDVKKILKTRIVQIMFVVLLVVMILDATMVMADARRFPEVYKELGMNAFRWWLLMNSSGFGFKIFFALNWIFPLLVTGMVFYSEQKSSISKFLIIRKSKNAYFISHICAVFVTAFIFFAVLLLGNVLVTWCTFPTDAPYTQQTQFCIPSPGTFADDLFQYSPLAMAIGYSLLNALAIAVYAVFATALQMIIHFRNQYIAIAVPVILMYTSTFLLESAGLYSYTMNIILQPMAASAMTDIIAAREVFITFAGWILLDIVLVIIGLIRNRDVL